MREAHRRLTAAHMPTCHVFFNDCQGRLTGVRRCHCPFVYVCFTQTPSRSVDGWLPVGTAPLPYRFGTPVAVLTSLAPQLHEWRDQRAWGTTFTVTQGGGDDFLGELWVIHRPHSLTEGIEY